MICFGDVPAGSVLPIPFASYGKTNGESITLTGLAVTDIEVYKGTGVTQRASDAGYALIDTDGIDIDTITGIHGFSIDLGDNTDAGFYAAGSYYYVVVSAVTIDSQTVSFIAATFRIVAAENTAGTPVVDVGRVAGTAQTAGDICGKIGTPSNLGGGATLAFNLSDIEGQTDDIGAAGAGLTAVPWNAAWDAEVESEVNDALVVHRLDELLNADSDIDGAAPPTIGSVFHELLTKAAAGFTYDQTTDSLEAVRDNMGTAQTGDSFARLGAPAGASVSADIAAAKVDTAAIKAKTDSLTFTVAGVVDTNVRRINGTPVNGDGGATPWGP